MRIRGWIVVLFVAGAVAPATAADLPGPRARNLALGDPAEQEMKFQFDFSVWVLSRSAREGGLYAAYQQRSLWSIDDNPRPFRMETDFRPEFGAVLGPAAGQGLTGSWPDWLAISMAWVHESNSLEDDFSRSWNRLVGTLHLAPEDTRWRASVSAWSAFLVEYATEGVTDHKGVGELRFVWDLPGRLEGSSLRLGSAFSPDAPDGIFFSNLELGAYLWPRFLPDWLFPGDGGPPVDVVIEGWFGSGEFLYDFARPTNRIRFGLALRP